MHSLPLQAETIFHIGSWPITNTVIAVWLTIVVLVIIGFFVRRAISNGYRGFWGGFALLLEGLFSFFEDLLGFAATKRLMPILGTFFLFIIAANWLGLLPGFGSITTGEEHVPILRGATTDLHLTLALGIISIVVIQVWGFVAQGFGYLKKYLNFSGPWYFTPIYVFVGLLEIVSEVAKVLSFGFRLFGNIFAGEVLLSIMIGLIPIVIPSVFYGLELFVGFIQAFVFVLLTAVFLKLAGEAHGETEH